MTKSHRKNHPLHHPVKLTTDKTRPGIRGFIIMLSRSSARRGKESEAEKGPAGLIRDGDIIITSALLQLLKLSSDIESERSTCTSLLYT